MQSEGTEDDTTSKQQLKGSGCRHTYIRQNRLQVTKVTRDRDGLMLSSTNGVGITGYPHTKLKTKNEPRHRPSSLHNNELKMDHRPKYKPLHHKNPRSHRK